MSSTRGEPDEARREPRTERGEPRGTAALEQQREQEQPKIPEQRDERGTPLFNEEQQERFRDQWNNLQTGFVDEPQQAVRKADELVANVLQTLASSFAERKRDLEHQWDREGEVATEDLRNALKHYRSFFNQLLNA